MGQYEGFAKEIVPEWIDLLIAVQSVGQVHLFKWANNAVIPVAESHASIGVGAMQIDPMLRDTRFSVPARAMLLFGLHIMRQTKRIVRGCGGNIEGVALHPNGGRTHFFSETTSRIEEFIALLTDYTNKRIWMLIAALSDNDEEFDKISGSIPSEIKELRQRYRILTR